MADSATDRVPPGAASTKKDVPSNVSLSNEELEDSPVPINAPQDDLEKATKAKASPGHWWRVSEVQDIPKK